jgi:DNA-binding NarL/FixJ family response regulator
VDGERIAVGYRHADRGGLSMADELIAKPSPFSGASVQTRDAHIAKRRADGLTHRQIADEFGISKSTSHRKTSTPKAIQSSD